jgi:two-component system, OmpR family, response regulator
MTITSESDHIADDPADVAIHIERRWWPDEADVILRLAARRVPRLLLVSWDAPAPTGTDCEEDWIRMPATESDIAARVASLSRRVARHASHPHIDEHHRLHASGGWSYIESPIDRRLLGHLLDKAPEPSEYDELIDVGWMGQGATLNALRVHVVRLNQRMEGLGLRIRSLRGAGYALDDGFRPRSA